MRGERVTVLALVEDGTDEMGAPTGSWQVEATVDDVLVAPAGTSDLGGSLRPDGARVDLALHVPKAYAASLRGRRVQVRGTTYEVVGAPQPYTTANTPGRWNRPVDLKEVSG